MWTISEEQEKLGLKIEGIALYARNYISDSMETKYINEPIIYISEWTFVETFVKVYVKGARDLFEIFKLKINNYHNQSKKLNKYFTTLFI